MGDAVELSSQNQVEPGKQRVPSFLSQGLDWRVGLALGVLVAVMFGLNLTAPLDMEGTNEERVAFYVLDLLETGNWLCPKDGEGRLISKPPVYTWLASAFSWVGGGVRPVTLRLPAVLALWWTGWLIYEAGRRRFGERAGLWGALALIFSPMAIVNFAHARYDVLFSSMVAWSAFAAYFAWERGKGWTWFWLGAAGATLVKGPFGLVLGAAGLLAWAWEWRAGHKLPLRGSALGGLALFLVLSGGWFVLAYRQEGQALLDKMIVGELVNHAVGQESGFPGSNFYKPIVTFITDGAPWSWIAAAGFWRIWRRPSSVPGERRFERFLLCWFLVGLVMLALASHHRARLLFPLMPPAALIAGRELAHWFKATAPVGKWIWGTVAVGLLAVAVFYHGIQPPRSKVKLTEAARESAELLNRQAGEIHLQHANSPFAFQYYRNELLPHLTLEEATRLLEGPETVFVAVAKPDDLKGWSDRWHVLYQGELGDKDHLAVVGNHPRLEQTSRMAYRVGPIEARWTQMRLQRARREEMELSTMDESSSLTLRNLSDRPQRIRVRLAQDAQIVEHLVRLEPDGTWAWPGSDPAVDP